MQNNLDFFDNHVHVGDEFIQYKKVNMNIKF